MSSLRESVTNDADLTAAFAPLHFTRITIPEKQMLELEGLETKDHLLQIPEANSSKATEYIQYDMAVDKDGDNTIVTNDLSSPSLPIPASAFPGS